MHSFSSYCYVAGCDKSHAAPPNLPAAPPEYPYNPLEPTAQLKADTRPSSSHPCSPSAHVSHITTDELLQKIHANEDIILVDTREEPKLQYNVEHIEVAISQPLSDIVSGTWKPDILEQEIVLYRTYGNTSDRATLELIDYGYTNVKTL